MWSTPWITPLATDGAAPSTTTNRIACSFRPKTRIASGNHAMDGMVCRPVISDATAVLRSFQRVTARPMRVPMRSASPNPNAARRSVVAMRLEESRVLRQVMPQLAEAPPRAPAEPRRLQLEERRRSARSASAMPMAASCGQAPLHRRRQPALARLRVEARGCRARRARARRRERAAEHAQSSAWRSTSSRSRDVIRSASAADFGVADGSRPRQVDGELLRHLARPAGQDGNSITQPDRLADVMRDEQDGELARRSTASPARRGGCRGSSRRASRMARPSAGPRRPGQGRARRRSAAACRPDSSCGRLSPQPSS